MGKYPTPSDLFLVNIRHNSQHQSPDKYSGISHPELDDVIHLETIDSTNLELKRRRSEFEGSNILIISDEQTLGQGQKGRIWESATCLGLWMSLHLGAPSQLAHKFHLLSIYTGTVIQHILAANTPLDILLKWPNDILCRNKKCGGVLTEIQWQGNEAVSVIVGVGINLTHRKHDFPPALRDLATSLRLEGQRSPDPEILAQDFVDYFFEGLAKLDEEKTLSTEWNKNAYNLDQSVLWESAGKTSRGLFRGINDSGDALIEINGEVKPFHTGEIRLQAL